MFYHEYLTVNFSQTTIAIVVKTPLKLITEVTDNVKFYNSIRSTVYSATMNK